MNALSIRREMGVAWNLFFEQYDFLLTPTVAVQPFPVLKNAPDGLDGKPNMATTHADTINKDLLAFVKS